MGTNSPRRRRWALSGGPDSRGLCGTLALGIVALVVWLGSEDGEIAAGPGEATSQANSAPRRARTDDPCATGRFGGSYGTTSSRGRCRDLDEFRADYRERGIRRRIEAILREICELNAERWAAAATA